MKQRKTNPRSPCLWALIVPRLDVRLGEHGGGGSRNNVERFCGILQEPVSRHCRHIVRVQSLSSAQMGFNRPTTHEQPGRLHCD